MESLEKNKYFILPQPKYINISKDNGMTLSSLLTIFLSKHSIKDNALLLSSKFQKHFNTFLNTIPIRDSALDDRLGENYYFAIITTELNYEIHVQRLLKELLKTHVSQFDEILHDCCYHYFPDIMESSLPLNEAYYIDISDGSIWILSQSVRGFYSGIQSLLQIIEHTLFLFDKFEEFIILPRMRIVDFSGWKTRGFSVNLNFFKPSTKALNELIPFLAKYKINLLLLYQESGFPESEENKKIIHDLCKFHQIDLAITTDFEKIPKKTLQQVQYSTSSRFIIPDYCSIFDKIMDTNIKQRTFMNGILVSASKNEFYLLDLLLLAIPIIAELIWNPQTPYSHDKLKFLSDATQVNVFENNILTQNMDLLRIFQSTSSDIQNISFIYTILGQARKNAFENTQLIEVLEWAFRLLELERALNEIRKSIKSNENPKSVTTQVIEQFQQYSNEFITLKSIGLKILEGSNRVEKGEYEKFFNSSGYPLKSLVETWIPEITRDQHINY